MVRAPCCSKVGMSRGPWTLKEDTLLVHYIQTHGEGNWRSMPKKAGLLRCGKSCRLRWMNYLRPDITRGNITSDEEDLIIRLHSLLGNRWSLIAGRLPGRTDNEIKNYWNSEIRKRMSSSNKKNGEESQRQRGKAMTLPENIKVHRPKATRVSVTPPPPPPNLTEETEKNNDLHESLDIEKIFTSFELPNNDSNSSDKKNEGTDPLAEEEDNDRDLSFYNNLKDQTLENIINEYQGLIGEDDHVPLSETFVDALLI